MNRAKILETLTRTPLLITPERAESLITLFEQHATLSPEQFKLAREGVDWCGNKVELEKMTIEGGLAMIPIKGPLGIDLGPFEKGAGATDYLDIMADIQSALENKKVENIMGVFDTPGGTWGGLPEATGMVEKANRIKPFYSYVVPGGQLCSAGIHLAAPSAGIFMAPSAQSGSIGVYCAYTDMSEVAKARGLKIKVFSSGKYKGMGLPGTSLTADQEQLLQDSVMELAGEFYGHIRKFLGDVPDEAMQGQSFRANKSKELGLCVDIVDSLEEMKAFLR